MLTKTTEPRRAKSAPAASKKAYRFYSFRIWYGMVASAWLSLLLRNRFAVSPSRLPFILIGFFTSALNSSLSIVQKLTLGRCIRTCVIEEPPIFIIGHWRTGTTFMHELLTIDERFTAPNTLECFAPAACLVLDKFARTFLHVVLPRNRPMDNMLMGWDFPQEDEFALMNLGLRSPYEVIVFPNHRRAPHPFLNMAEVAPDEVAAWKAVFLSFLQQVNLRSKREQKGAQRVPRIVLKSPHHTARLHILLDMFPEAKFVHLVRDPCEVFLSSVRCWRALFDTQGCQTPEVGALADGTPDIEQYVIENMNLLYRNFFAQIAQIPAQNFCQVRYEDLVGAPVAEVGRVYRQLQLGCFEKTRPKLEAYVHGLHAYKTNQYEVSPHLKARVHRHWPWYMDRFGYRPRPAA